MLEKKLGNVVERLDVLWQTVYGKRYGNQEKSEKNHM
jgi:hypothetical protein